jgi:nucleotidyltransferase/DNA polymerase involved in DNA repair
MEIDGNRAEVDEMARENAAWLLKKSLRARTVTIKVRYEDFTTITRSHSAAPTSDERIARRAGPARKDRRRSPTRSAARRRRARLHDEQAPADWLPFD